MQFPISMVELRNYRNSILLKEAVNTRVNSIVNEICSGIEHMLKTSNINRYVHGAERFLVFDSTRSPSQHIVINKVLEELRHRFVDSSIVLDPLLKTITVDWTTQGPGDWKRH